MDQAIIESIKIMDANGYRLNLPAVAISNYPALKKVLQKAGGKYNKNGFIFTTDAQAVKDRLIGGETIDDKKKFQFFPTPADLVKKLIDLADIQPSDTVLEPSAGRAAIAKELRGKCATLRLIELNPENVRILNTDYDLFATEIDFLEFEPQEYRYVDKIVANPPFTKNQDIDHILHMYKFLKPGGRIVTMASKSWTFGIRNKQTAFRNWLNSVNAEIIEVEAGAFKSSGTNIETVILVINK